VPELWTLGGTANALHRMSIKTEITQDDYTAFIKHVARSVSTTSGDRIVGLFVCIAIGLGIGFVLSLSHLSSHTATFPALVCGVFAGAFLLMAMVSKISLRQMRRMRPAEDGYILGSQETFLEDEGIRQKSGHHQSVFQWSLVRTITVTEQHVFVMVDRVAGIILPRRAFSSDVEREQFVSEIERRSGKTRT